MYEGYLFIYFYEHSLYMYVMSWEEFKSLHLFYVRIPRLLVFVSVFFH